MRIRFRKQDGEAVSAGTPQNVHIDTFGIGAKGRKGKPQMAELSTDQRNALPDSDFALPKERRYPIHNRSHAANALARASGKPEESTVKAAVYRKYPDMKANKSEDVELTVPIWKSEVEGKVFGVVLQPGLEDSQGDVVSADEIEKACHRYMVQSRKADVQHSEVQAEAHLIENYIAPQDLDIEGEPVAKGSWVQAWQVLDPVIKQEIGEGKLTGLSIGGSGVRVEA